MIVSDVHSQKQARFHSRRGATLVEAGIAMTVLMMFLIGILDFTLASFRIQMLNHVAHRVAREAAIHGPRAVPGWRGGIWGPTTFVTTLAAADPAADVGRTVSAGLNADAVTITIEWPNGNNAVGSPVVVETAMDWTPSFMRPLGLSVMTLRGQSRHVIVH
jgi:hypothetical protein